MKTLIDSMTDASLTDRLIGIRLGVVPRRHNAHFLRDISPDTPDPGEITCPAAPYLPPRRQWGRLRKATRRKLAATWQQRILLRGAVKQGLAAPSGTHDWADRLRDLIEEVRRRAADPECNRIAPPEILVSPKGARKRGSSTEYRLLATYPLIEDRLLLGAVTGHLSSRIDPLFHESACAFRGPGRGDRSNAIERIVEYISKRQDRPVYVAECDVQGFFDTIPHARVLAAYDRFGGLLEADGDPLDPLLRRWLENYLASYDYWDYARPRALEVLRGRNNAILGGTANRPDADGPSGIPQGGALSPLLANMVMDGADRIVMGKGDDPELLYLRYCDDMVILHTDRNRCREAMDRYVQAVRDLGCLIHPPERVIRYGRGFHEARSKRPFRLGAPEILQNSSPWMNFLGYQIRFDGGLRVRRKSLEQHHARQLEFAMKVKQLLARDKVRLRCSNPEIMRRVAGHMVAAGVGKALLHAGVAEGRCWADAFSLVAANPHACSQMRWLDRCRTRLLDSVIYTLRRFHSENMRAPGQTLDLRPRLGMARSYLGHLHGIRSRCRKLRFTEHEPGRYGKDF